MTVLKALSQKLFIAEGDLFRFITSAPHRYKKYKIPKRNGQGSRDIAQPSKELKFIQKKAIIDVDVFNGLPIHKTAKAYKKGVNIKDNAEVHKNNSYILKMDFSNFFPSIIPNDLIQHIEKYKQVQLTAEDKKIIGSLFFYKKYRNTSLVLSIGAPTSPYISNTIMYDFDVIVFEFCVKNNIRYTRYADDLVFSTNTKDLLFSVPDHIQSLINEIDYPTLNINDNKTVFLSKRNNRHITGLVISNEGTVSIGRSKKRKIRSMIFEFSNGKLSKEETLYLQGYLSFCEGVDNSFLTALNRKYGDAIIVSIRNYGRN